MQRVFGVILTVLLGLGSAVVAKVLLAGVAIYWGVVGDFVDFWDAFLWLAGFFIIELNIFKWQQDAAAPTNQAV